ncbi:GLPGLI family protein [Flavobacterium sp. FlaQc-57]|uniref:GLPGLI family protein n=1 Tax=Flavobacterium sp. FlaQc-57 TaxID=3374186 RepID=UPI0037570406
MKRNILLLLFISFQANSQSVKATYIEKVLKSIGATSTDISNEIKPKTYTYTYADKKSLSELIPSQKSSLDTSYLEIKGRKLETYHQISLPSINTTFKNLNNKSIQKEYTISDKDFSAKDKLTDYEWTITDETTIINGYTCKKATSTKSLAPITAWYAEEIPVNDGPSIYWGLPGLILKVELGEYTVITIDKITISKENIEIKEPEIKSRPVFISQMYKDIKIYLDSISPLTKYK